MLSAGSGWAGFSTPRTIKTHHCQIKSKIMKFPLQLAVQPHSRAFRRARGLASLAIVAAVGFLATAARPVMADDSSTASTSQETPVQRDARMAWFRDARFGMFIHWG